MRWRPLNECRHGLRREHAPDEFAGTARGVLSRELLFLALVGAEIESSPRVRIHHDVHRHRTIDPFAAILEPPAPGLLTEAAAPTLARFRELRERANGDLSPLAAKEILRELKAVGGDLRSLRLALTGAERGPELWTVVLALPRAEALRRIDAAL